MRIEPKKKDAFDVIKIEDFGEKTLGLQRSVRSNPLMIRNVLMSRQTKIEFFERMEMSQEITKDSAIVIPSSKMCQTRKQRTCGGKELFPPSASITKDNEMSNVEHRGAHLTKEMKHTLVSNVERRKSCHFVDEIEKSIIAI